MNTVLGRIRPLVLATFAATLFASGPLIGSESAA